MRAGWVGLWGLVAALPVNAQVGRPRQVLRVDAGVAAWESEITGAVAASHQIGLFRARRLRLGYGIRYSLIARMDQAEFTVARASLIQQGIREPVLIDQSRNHALNVAFYANYRVLPAVEAGFNIDVIGLGFGPRRMADSRSADPQYQGRYTATPSRFNLLEGGKPDRGTLNSEFYLAYWFGPRAGVRAGASHEVAEYTLAAPLAFGNDRFRHSSTLAFVSFALTR